ncbi:hypothetical protein MK280_09910, partial [Myxococcota bacterium]|nr:hypothetical protein [Myxococcota bacterium]
ASESIRRAGVDLDFATAWSFPPENWLTLWAPTFFGDASATRVDYFGRWWFWDDVAFVGVTGFGLAMVGVLAGRHPFRTHSVVLVVFLGLLAMGRSTPLFAWAFHGVPGFDLIRAPSKFMFFVTFFLSFWAGLGWDHLREVAGETNRSQRGQQFSTGRSVIDRTGWLTLGVGVLLLAGAAWIGLRTDQGEASLIRWLAPAPAEQVVGLRAARQWATMASSSFWIAGATAIVLSVFLLAARRVRFLLLGVVLLACIELLGFALAHRGGVMADAGMRQRRGQQPVFDRLDDLRVMESGVASNAPMGFHIGGLWGYDPVVLERYAMLVARSQGRSVEELDNVRGQPPDRGSELLRLLRLGAIVRADPSRRLVQVEWPEDPLDRFEFVSDYQIENDPEAILGVLESTPFDPRRWVVLEEPPSVEPAGEPPTQAGLSVVSESTDHVELKVDLDRPALLLWTDSYADGWEVEALPGSVQSNYRAQPANLTIRSVSLAAGSHHFRWVYWPAHFKTGVVFSALGWMVYGALFGLWVFRTFRGPGSGPAAV